MVRRALVPLSSALLAALSGASASGLLISDAAAQVGRRQDEEHAPAPLLLALADSEPVLVAGHSSHSSHSSHYSGNSGHSSHASHYSGSRGGGGYDTASESTPAPVARPEPPPPPPKPARVSFAAFPGGKIFVDGKPVGTDATGTLVLKPGSYVVKISNRFLGEHSTTVELTDGQSGVISLEW